MCGQCLRRWPLATLTRRFFRDRAAVIFYHGVWGDDCPTYDGRKLFGGMRLRDFAAEMRRLQTFFQIVPLSRIHEPSSPPAIAITFDDGLDLTAAGATAVLDQLGIRATMFVNTASVAGGHLMWMHRFSVIRAERGDQVLLRELNRIQQNHHNGRTIDTLDGLIEATRQWPQAQKDDWAAEMWDAAGLAPLQDFLNRHRPYFDIEGLKDWLRRGHEVGFHTHSHPFCSRVDDDLLQREVIDPVTGLRRALALSETAFAYPFGDRCRPEHETKLQQSRLFTALFGTAGFSMRSAASHAMERVEAEHGVDREVFGKPILRAYKRAKEPQ